MASRAESRPYSIDCLEKTGVSGELMYFALSGGAFGRTRPPNATHRLWGSEIGNMIRPRNRS